ncbi:gustatory receptor 68a-like [Chrysoperla carnea]|uniref:gustatory receptor 68a-like n=1 Tax=Chrysoperla carnea TaxID=189513 RepID=UPI001D084D34|nr:gustatory receptor 68a-like [Chrysoperla carnea]
MCMLKIMELHSALMPLCILSFLSGCIYIHIDKNTGEIRPLCWIRKSYNLLVIIFLERFILVNASLPTVIEMQTGYNEKCLKNATIKIKCNLLKLVPSVRELNRIHNMLYESSQYANRFFGMSMLILVLQVFFSIIQNVIYIAYLQFVALSSTQHYFSNIGVTLSIFWLLFDLSLVVILCSLCEYTVKEANQTGILAYKLLLNDNLSSEIANDLQQFANQIQQQNIKFTAYDLFDINLNSLTQLIGSVTSYIIVALEFYNLSPELTRTSYNNSSTTRI